MAIEGEELAAELYDMRFAGTVVLPSVAAVFAQGTRHLHNSAWQQEETFDSGYTGLRYTANEDDESAPIAIEVTTGQALGLVYAPWTSLRDTVQKLMGDTSNALVGAGAALNLIADSYAQSDQAAGAELDRLSTQNADQLVPPQIPEVKTPDDHQLLDDEPIDPNGD